MDYQVVNIPWGSVSNILRIKIRDLSDNNGAGKTGLTIASSGLLIGTQTENEATPTMYGEGASTLETIATLGTYAAPTATKARFKLVDDTNMKGHYELQLADARFKVAGAKRLYLSLSGAADMSQTDVVINLVDSPVVLVNTTMTVTDQLTVVLASGSADNDAYNNMWAIITDQATALQKAVVPVYDYVGSTKTVTLAAAPAFTIATGDLITIVAAAGGLSGRTITGTSPVTGPFSATFS